VSDTLRGLGHAIRFLTELYFFWSNECLLLPLWLQYRPIKHALLFSLSSVLCLLLNDEWQWWVAFVL